MEEAWLLEQEVIKKEIWDAICRCGGDKALAKVEDPIGLGDFLLISLIGSYYTIVAKILAERVKKVVGKVVGDVQNAFIKGRFILDGTLITNEAMDWLKKKKKDG
ncbi:hypothetical protein Tco_1535024 [Tanacetum coccineum]